MVPGNDRSIPGNWIIKTFRRIAKAIAFISYILNTIGMVVLGLIILVIVVDVVGRAVFNKPLLGSFELTEFSLVVVVFFSVAWCAVQKGHIEVTIITDRLKARPKAVLAVFTSLLSLGIVSIIAWQCILEAIYVMGTGKSSAILAIPNAPFYWVMSSGFVLLGFQVLIDFFNNIVEAAKK